jgi:rhodanese-related sulfurtransferase
MRIGRRKFIVLSTLSAVIWVGSAIAVGMLFHSQIDELLLHMDRIGGVAAVAVAGLLAAYIAFKWWERARFYRLLRMARISVPELYELIQAGVQPIIVDVRSHTAKALEPRSIPGARHVPVDEVGRHVADLPRDRDIVVYCTCPNEASAARVAKILMNHGFKKVRPLHGGLDAWVAAGYSVDTPAGR